MCYESFYRGQLLLQFDSLGFELSMYLSLLLIAKGYFLIAPCRALLSLVRVLRT